MFLTVLLLSVSTTTAFVDVNVIPMNRDTVLAHQTVIVQGERIVSVGPTEKASIPAGAMRVEGKGKYLMPGLVDMHVHLYSPPELAMNLVNGITTVYNLNGRPSHLLWRDRIAAGQMLGPSIVTCGPTFFQCDTAEDARSRVDAMAKAGYDAVKIYDGVSKEAFPVIVDTARAHHMLVVGHIPRAPGFAEVIKKKMPIAHAEEFLYTVFNDGKRGRKDIPDVARQAVEAGVSVTATLVTYDHIYRQATDLKALLARPATAYLAPWIADAWQPGVNTYEQRFKSKAAQKSLAQGLDLQKELIREIHRQGGKVLAGTDANCVGSVPGFELAEEIRNFGECGFTPFEAIKAATSDCAEALNQGKDFGTVEAGKRADLVLLTENPLSDLHNLEMRSGVMVRGRWLPAPTLRQMLANVKTDYARESATGLALLRRDPEKALAYFDDVDPFEKLRPSLITKLSILDGTAGYRKLYKSLKSTSPNSSIISEQAVNDMGYWWLNTRKDAARAIDVFLLNTEEHPSSANVWDSLGEAYVAAGNKAKAIESYQKALAIDPNLPSSIEALKKLTG